MGKEEGKKDNRKNSTNVERRGGGGGNGVKNGTKGGGGNGTEPVVQQGETGGEIEVRVERRESTTGGEESLTSLLKEPSAREGLVNCLEKLNYTDFRYKMLNKTQAAAAAATRGMEGGGVKALTTFPGAGGEKAENIFKTLMNEIKGLQVRRSEGQEERSDNRILLQHNS